MLEYLLRQAILLVFAFIGFLILFNRLATPEQKEGLKPALKQLPRRVLYVLSEFIYLIKNKIGGVQKDEKIRDINDYRRRSERLRRGKQ